MLRKADGFRGGGYAHRDTQQSRHNNANQDGALDFAHKQDNCQCQADQEQPEGRLVQSRQRRHTGIKSNNTHVQQTDIATKCRFRRQWHSASCGGSL